MPYDNKLKRVYQGMKYRCSNPENARKYYYDKGIKCEITYDELMSIWERDSGHLLKSPSIDRIDSNGNYSFDNCRFIERSENSRAGKFGENNPSAKLTKKEVAEIRVLLDKGGKSHAKIAKMFGVSASLIFRIKHRKVWVSE